LLPYLLPQVQVDVDKSVDNTLSRRILLKIGQKSAVHAMLDPIMYAAFSSRLAGHAQE
jgi:hypothetical protein